ncbi:MAG TPA: hypothetical protein VLI93_15995 [Acetobacteraceae bacterium]|nr:hypothetical protein [Acetobacteraceae bacterium]
MSVFVVFVAAIELPIVFPFLQSGLYEPRFAGREPVAPSSPADWMRIGVSLVLLIAALWVILSKRYVPTDRHWAYGIIGSIVGYWLGSA